MNAVAIVPWQALAPQFALTAGLLGAVGLGIAGGAPRAAARALSTAAVAAALILALWARPAEGPLVRLDGLGLAWQALIYAAALPLALFARYDDEVPAILLLGCVLGMGLVAASGSLLMLFIGLELMSLPAYLLVSRLAADRRGDEAALKYFFAGSAAGAFFLLGMALFYAETRTLSLGPAHGPLAGAGLALMGSAALFKLGAVPLHFWLPDVYESAPPELAGFFSTAMKAAGVLLLMRLVALDPGSALAAALPWVGAATALFGALLALRQERLQRLLAYSSISHAGNLLLGVGAWAALGARPGAALALFAYLGAYLFMSNGAFLFVKGSGAGTRAELRGLAAGRAGAAAAFAALLLALGGMPPSAGFLAKLLVFWDALRGALYIPLIAAGLAVLVSLGYYLGLIREMYLEEGGIPSGPGCRRALAGAAFCAVPAALLGLFPWLFEPLRSFLGS